MDWSEARLYSLNVLYYPLHRKRQLTLLRLWGFPPELAEVEEVARRVSAV